jgi:alcohol dehydrogenase class IV
VLAFNRPAIETRMRRLAAYLELQNPSFDAILDWVLGLRAEFEIPHTLKALGLDDKRLDRLAAMAVADPTAAGNPRELAEADCRRLYQDSYSGNLANRAGA